MSNPLRNFKNYAQVERDTQGNQSDKEGKKKDKYGIMVKEKSF